MGYQRSLRALAEHWTEVSGRLSADTVRYLVELIQRLSQASPGAATERAEEIGRVLDQVLPRDDHPVRQALDAAEARGTAALAADWQELASRLLRQADLETATAPAPSPAEVMFWTGRWLLAEEALTEDELLVRGQDPGDAELIRLDRDDGGEQWPAFQFGADGAALPLVRTVNRLLGAEQDPWGVADWWLGHNQWLNGVPARLIGEVADDLIVAAARAVDPGV